MRSESRKDIVDMLTRLELQNEANDEVNGQRINSAGAQFAKVGGFAGSATTNVDGKTKRKRDQVSGGVKTSGGGASGGTAGRSRECSRCCRNK